jgi:hypothetical protein
MSTKFQLYEDSNSLAGKKSPKLLGFEDKSSFCYAIDFYKKLENAPLIEMNAPKSHRQTPLFVR